MHIKTIPVGQVKAGVEDGLAEGEFIVYPSTFTKEPDSYGDVVAPGAFAETLQKWKDAGDSLPGLYGHRMDDPDFFVAYATDMGEDEHGWWVRGMFDMESPKGPHVYRLVKGRRLRQLSFAYDTLEEGAVELEDGRKANELRKLAVHEFSFVPIGANQDTSVVAVKGLVDGIKAGRVLSAKNETALRDARDAIDSVLAALADEDGQAAPAATPDDQEKASAGTEGKGTASDEEPRGAKSSVESEDLKSAASVDLLAAELTYYALLESAERGS
ncbi:HK97 family phage prohead protease [Micrococcus sp. NPDC078436]|uniref:HK97 family phage prohead protease n=1 Tax=Micrococcus sp. NPDC078436 TaxID=3154960 RepID=UPI003450D7C2